MGEERSDRPLRIDKHDGRPSPPPRIVLDQWATSHRPSHVRLHSRLLLREIFESDQPLVLQGAFGEEGPFGHRLARPGPALDVPVRCNMFQHTLPIPTTDNQSRQYIETTKLLLTL